jgi:hypothetical protein
MRGNRRQGDWPKCGVCDVSYNAGCPRCGVFGPGIVRTFFLSVTQRLSNRFPRRNAVSSENYDLPLNQTDGGVPGFACSSVSNSLHAPTAEAAVCSGCPIRPFSPRSAPRKSRPPATARYAQRRHPQAGLHLLQVVLGSVATALAGLEASTGSGAARDGLFAGIAPVSSCTGMDLAAGTTTGRRCVSRELRDLFFRMVAENQTLGARAFMAELKMLGFDISERTVTRWTRRAPVNPEPAKRWALFLNNHREAIAAMDFFYCADTDFWRAPLLSIPNADSWPP